MFRVNAYRQKSIYAIQGPAHITSIEYENGGFALKTTGFIRVSAFALSTLPDWLKKLALLNFLFACTRFPTLFVSYMYYFEF